MIFAIAFIVVHREYYDWGRRWACGAVDHTRNAEKFEYDWNLEREALNKTGNGRTC